MTAKLTVYRRDYCGYCMRLETCRWPMPKWRTSAATSTPDPEAAAFVRSVNNGDETVPTVVIGDDDVRINPDPNDLLRDLGFAPKPACGSG